jgi:hypothetical protein
MRFFDAYRRSVINDDPGRDLVRRDVESHAGAADRPARRRDVFIVLVSSPRPSSSLQ